MLALNSKAFGLAARRQLRSENAAKGTEKYHEEKRVRWLTEDVLKRVITTLDKRPNGNAANAVRLQQLSGARVRENLSRVWAEFGLQHGARTKAAHHRKQKRAEHLQLSTAAAELLTTIKSAGSKYLIPSSRRDGSMTDLK